MRTPAVGKDVDAYCTKCKMLLNHVIVAKVADTIKRVKCLTCGSDHVYKTAEKKAVSSSAKSASKRASNTTLKTNDLDALLKGRDLSRAKKYNPSLTFAKNDILDHTSFGMGIVLQNKDGSKIDVVFRVGMKTLVHAIEE